MIVASIAQMKSINNDNLSNDFFDHLYRTFNEHLYTCGDRDMILNVSTNFLIGLNSFFSLPLLLSLYFIYKKLLYITIYSYCIPMYTILI